MATRSQCNFSLSFDAGLLLFDAPENTHNRRSERTSARALQLLGSVAEDERAAAFGLRFRRIFLA